MSAQETCDPDETLLSLNFDEADLNGHPFYKCTRSDSDSEDSRDNDALEPDVGRNLKLAVQVDGLSDP